MDEIQNLEISSLGYTKNRAISINSTILEFYLKSTIALPHFVQTYLNKLLQFY